MLLGGRNLTVTMLGALALSPANTLKISFSYFIFNLLLALMSLLVPDMA